MEYYRLENISKNYEDEKIIDNINLDLKEGEINAFVGKSGVGKTTLFNILAGFENPSYGNIFLKGKNITNDKKNISYMTQKSLLLPHLTLIDNICLPFILQKINKKTAYDIVIPVLCEFNLLDYKDKYPSELSGGMKQRVSFLRAYMKKGDLMLLDEPFSSIDSITKHYVYSWFKNIVEKRESTIIFITHDIKEAILLSDKVYILSGKPSTIVFDIKIDETKRNKENFIVSDLFLDYYNSILNKLGEIKD